MPSYTATPGFTWALPEEKKDAAPSVKPLANPLLLRKPPTHSPAARTPLSPMDNEGIRQRRKPATTPMAGSARKLVPPPKASFLTGDAGIANEVPQTGNNDFNATLALTGNASLPALGYDGAWEHWVLVYGFTTQGQYELVVRRFHSFGLIISQRASGNWVAFQYESRAVAEKALCTQHCVLIDAVVICATRLTSSLRDSLDWTSSKIVSPGQQHSVGLNSNVQLLKQRGEPAYQDEDILLLGNGTQEMNKQGKRSVCEMVMSWVFGW